MMDELKTQLDQLYQALQSADEESKPGLQQLISDFEDLLEGNCSSTTTPSSADPCPSTFIPSADSALNSHESQKEVSYEDDEFLKFQAEIAALDSSNQTSSESGSFENGNPSTDTTTNHLDEDTDNNDSEKGTSESIEEELKALEGMKCLAPFEHHWGQVGYYSSIILCVENSSHGEDHEQSPTVSTSDGQIKVRVVFTQPIVESMKPCDFFMEGRCRFVDDQCKFSHGEVISLSDLREYKDPDYSRVVPGAKVFAKYSDGLWYKAAVSKLTETGDCEIIYNSYKNEVVTVPLHETCPDDDEDDTSSSSDDDGIDSDSSPPDEDNLITPVVFVEISGSTPLGDWERHTKGIGSKLMAKMGYVIGTGLGKNSEGRINPVDAVVLPPGRSLDRCMELKEKAGSSGANLFSVERRLKRMKQKEAMRAKADEKKQKETESVFNFLNSHLNLKKPKKSKQSGSSSLQNYNKETCKDLSKNLLAIGANIKLVEKDISKCKESIKRHEGRDQTTVDKVKQRLEVLEHQLAQFRNNEAQIALEQNNRTAKKKLTLF